MAVTYNTANATLSYIFRATGGGVTFSANLAAETAFDYFPNDAVANDAIYFGSTTITGFSSVDLNIGTAFAATSYTIVWEYYNAYSGWKTVTNCLDDTVMFSVTGTKSFKFGIPWEWARNTVNSLTTCQWIRARISAVDTITEGGANQTSAVTLKDGKVNIDGYTEGSPCTLATIRNYLVANYSYLNCTVTNSLHYDFTMVRLMMNSRTVSTNESFEVGSTNSRAYPNAGADFSYLRMGASLDATHGLNGSTLYVNGVSNSYPINFSANTLVYGSNVIGVGSPGYPSWTGTWVDSSIKGINWAGGGASITNCRIEDPGTWILTTFYTGFVSNSVILTGAYLGLFYRSGDITIPNLSYGFSVATGKYVLYFYQVDNSPTFTFTNPSPQLPGATTDNKIISRTVGAYQAYAKVFYYDTSAGTYTDYTTEFGDATADNAPIGGDVGDIYYFGVAGQVFNTSWNVLTSLSSNDYEYIFEFWDGAWRACDPVNDRTDNLTVNNEYIYMGNGTRNYYTSTTINGYTGYFMRMRIVTKGTGSPMISKLTFSNQTGLGNWNVYEKFSLDLKIVNRKNVAIPNARINIFLNGVSQYSGVTDASGIMTQQTLSCRRWFFDPINSFANYHQIGETTYGDYDVVISKTGYETKKIKYTMNKKRDEIEILENKREV